MRNRAFTLVCVIAILVVIGRTPLAAQGKDWTPARTSDGQPDLQGVWSNATVTPLERPSDLAGKQVFTEEEAAEYAKQAVDRNKQDGRVPAPNVLVAYNDLWFDRGTSVVATKRTSLIVDPPDGQIPPLTAAGRQRAAELAEARRLHPADGPEDRSLQERCLKWATAGPPMLPGPYNSNYQIVQVPGYVIIQVEMIHDARVIPVDGRPHLPQNVRSWMGDSRGHWEGNTLVVDTTNFTDKTTFRGSDQNMHLIERFTRTSDDTLMYQFTVDNETAFARAWTAELPMTKSPSPMF